MRLRTEHKILNDNPTNYGKDEQTWLADENSVLSSHDQTLIKMAGELFVAMQDVEDVKNDQDYMIADSLSVKMIREYKEKPVWSRDNEKFIRESFEKAEGEKRIAREIDEIKAEAERKGISATTEKWVHDWNSRKNSYKGETERIREIKDFITGSLNNEINESEVSYRAVSKKPVTKILKYMALPVAAAACLFVLLRISGPSSSTETIYNEMYQPLPAVIGITRGGKANIKDSFNEGIVKYKNGDYNGAALSFSEALKTFNNSSAVMFYYGITQVALGNYSSAVDLLENIACSDTEYGKDACWYLGLAYLKLGEKEKALKYLKPLSESRGFYREKARKIVRRLR